MKSLITVAVLSLVALVSVSSTWAAPPVTVSVGHLCCKPCEIAATTGLAKVADGIKVEGLTITFSAKADDLLPSLEAMRKGGVPAKSLLVSGPATFGILHLCCSTCRTGLASAIAAGKIATLDPAATKVGENNVVVAPKAGMKLDLIAVIAAMETGGFSPSKITIATTTAKATRR